jgi:hypothetical protein
MVLARWGVPETPGNLDALEHALAVPIHQLQHLSASLPRWACAASQTEMAARFD